MRTKISEMNYKRADIDGFIALIDALTNKVAIATSAKGVLDARWELLKEYQHIDTMYQLSYIRFTLNTSDEFYLVEKDYYDNNFPKMYNQITKFRKAVLDSKYLEELKKSINPLVIMSYKNSLKINSDAVVDDLVEENKLTTEYAKFMSSLLFDFNGETIPLTLLNAYLSDTDRNVRKAAHETFGNKLKESSDFLDSNFDALVKIRNKIAKKLGFKDFVEVGYARMGRNCYDREMVETFRNNVKNDIVPMVKKIKESLAKDLSIEKLMFYDNNSTFLIGEPKPILSTEEIFEKGKEMYADLSDKTANFFDVMLEADAFDVLSRQGKWGGGYCTYIPDYEQPFILANFNGSSGDIDVLTHEIGHAFAAYETRFHDADLREGGLETAECHSMSMEFFAWKYMDKFFGTRAKDYKFKHVIDSLSFIPYGTIVDKFQHIIYENPTLSPKERKDVWLGLEKEFRPHLSLEGIPYFEDGGRWQYQMHIYETPFYYIDYCLAQTIALQYLLMSEVDYVKAFENYCNFVGYGWEKSFVDIIELSNLSSPFKVGALSFLAKDVERLINKLK